MYERFTDRARKVMQLANQEAQRLNHASIGTEHILLGLAKEGNGLAATILEQLQVDLRRLRESIDALCATPIDDGCPGRLPLMGSGRKAINDACVEARSLGCNYVGTEHLLLAVLRTDQESVREILLSLGVSPGDLWDRARRLVAEEFSPRPVTFSHRFSAKVIGTLVGASAGFLLAGLRGAVTGPLLGFLLGWAVTEQINHFRAFRRLR